MKWGVSVDRIYRAVRIGKLRRYRQEGHQAYYAHHELVDAFGQPRHHGAVQSGHNKPAYRPRRELRSPVPAKVVRATSRSITGPVT